MRKLLFLDIDGVCNSKNFALRNPKGGAIGIDSYAAFLVGKIQLDTNCEVVLSSTWRLWPETRKEVEDKVVKFIDCTPDLHGKPRGEEIQLWLERNDAQHALYAILDDDPDMLEHQMDNFFRTTWENGITPEIADAVTKHLNRLDRKKNGNA